jgi:2-polyprenyl-3-methyl-5-hydroxy-6-metoxy-1,4-benzoquinol methylase
MFTQKVIGPEYKRRFKHGQDLDREFDTTQLKYNSFKHQAHKDYLGHVFRWGFASRFVKQDMSVLDVGCGQDLPFMQSLGGANANSVPRLYVGCDLNNRFASVRRNWATLYPGFNFIADYQKIIDKHGKFDVIVNFEVYEHIAPDIAPKLLCGIRECLKPGGRLIFSTPVYCDSYKMARNHINERTKAEIEDDLHQAGFKIIKQFGVFGNIRDYKLAASNADLDVYNDLREFYGDEILGCYLAPKYPEASRNICHVCTTDDQDVEECELKKSVLL